MIGNNQYPLNTAATTLVMTVTLQLTRWNGNYENNLYDSTATSHLHFDQTKLLLIPRTRSYLNFNLLFALNQICIRDRPDHTFKTAPALNWTTHCLRSWKTLKCKISELRTTALFLVPVLVIQQFCILTFEGKVLKSEH